ncbi:MAG: hypothetical protein AAF387_05115 [Pseudomonadota bacterium]
MKKRSPLLAASVANNADFEISVESNMNIVLSTPNSIGNTFLCDLSAIRKRLVVGKDAKSWLANHVNSVPDQMYAISVLPDNALAVRIHRQQWLLIDGYRSDLYDELFMMPSGVHGDVLFLDYECADFALGGPQVDEIMSELCPLPIGDLTAHFWCATRMAHTDTVLIPYDQPYRHYRILATPADARFVYAILSEVLRDLGGEQIGFEQYWRDYCKQ